MLCVNWRGTQLSSFLSRMSLLVQLTPKVAFKTLYKLRLFAENQCNYLEFNHLIPLQILTSIRTLFERSVSSPRNEWYASKVVAMERNYWC